MAGPKGVFNYNFLISLMWTFGVNHQVLIVEENGTARLYPILENRTHPVYISSSIINIKKHLVKEKKSKHWLELEFKKLII